MRAAKDAAGRVVDVAAGGASVVVSVLPAVKEGAAGVVSTGREALEQKAADFKEALEAWLKRKIQHQLQGLVDRIPGLIKDSLEDPDMPRRVSRAKDRTVDAVWPDVRDEIMWEVAVYLDGQPPEETPKEEDFGAACCLCRFFRYHLFPCDRSIWRQWRDPVFIAFSLVSLAPISGLCSLIYLFIFLIIDRGEEYQLIQFILQFKGMQFLSHGIIRTLTGFFIYVGCVTALANEADHSCEENGPGIVGRMEVIIGGWVLQIVLVWTAFCLLPWSKDKGRSQLTGQVKFERSARMERKGGMLIYLLVWDMLSFLVCSGFLLWFASTRPARFDQAYTDWAVQHTFYACQIVYGYLSMPFFFFTLPVLKAVLTHSVPTAYNSDGVCCKVRAPESSKRNRDARDEELLDQQESNTILGEVKAIFFGGGKGGAEA
uniref:Uncharacterized protein n=1 Tax=Alexandrium monilatum TaxID=311494 RepID=A0A7S4RTH6_9DINO